MERPYREVHEFYRILFLRAQAQQQAEEERAKKEAEEAAKQRKANAPKGLPPTMKPMSTDVNEESLPSPPLSSFDMDALEDVMDEIM